MSASQSGRNRKPPAKAGGSSHRSSAIAVEQLFEPIVSVIAFDSGCEKIACVVSVVVEFELDWVVDAE